MALSDNTLTFIAKFIIIFVIIILFVSQGIILNKSEVINKQSTKIKNMESEIKQSEFVIDFQMDKMKEMAEEVKNKKNTTTINSGSGKYNLQIGTVNGNIIIGDK